VREIMKINRLIIIAFALLFLFFISSGKPFAQESKDPNYKPIAGYVPDEETAIKIAVAVWTPIYCKKQIEKEKPYKAILKNGVWYVSGSLPKDYITGGVAEAEITKSDGRIIKIIHGK
jgi:hypothetical protein